MSIKMIGTKELIRNELDTIQPHKIAVAYVGKGWQKYIPLNTLKEIVLCPELGSNPSAIEEIIKKLDVSNVHFLNGLHSKLYLGEKAALVGSMNLSDNGLGDGGHYELAISITDPSLLQEMNSTFESYREKAQEEYPTEKKKFEKLRQLKREWDSAQISGFFTKVDDNKNIPELNEYDSKIHTIHILPYGDESPKHDNKIIQKYLKNKGDKDLVVSFSNEIGIPESYPIKENDWVMLWHEKLPDDKIEWLYVNKIIKKGCKNPGYTKLIVQSKNNRILKPFNLDDKKVRLKIKEALKGSEFGKIEEIFLTTTPNKDQSRVRDFLRKCMQA